jgi:hypothetical protein
MIRSASISGSLAIATLVLTTHALAGVPSLIAGLHTGDELRYQYTLSTEETTSLTGKTGPESLPARVVSMQNVVVSFKVTADTTALDIVEATFESANVAMETGDVSVSVDAGAPAAPDDKAPAGARDLYAWFHPLVGAKLTLNISPGSGEITTITGGEDLLKGVGGPHLRRYLDPNLFRANFGCIFQLKSNSQMPPPGQKWYVKTHAYGRGVIAPVWETRSVEFEEGGVATIKGTVKASAKPEDSTKASVFFRGVDADASYLWDTMRGRMRKASRAESIQTRYEIGAKEGVVSGGTGVRQDSDLTCRSSLEIVEKPQAKTETPKDAGGASPEPKKTP